VRTSSAFLLSEPQASPTSKFKFSRLPQAFRLPPAVQCVPPSCDHRTLLRLVPCDSVPSPTRPLAVRPTPALGDWWLLSATTIEFSLNLSVSRPPFQFCSCPLASSTRISTHYQHITHPLHHDSNPSTRMFLARSTQILLRTDRQSTGGARSCRQSC
jgi:hypothetical protein